MNLLIYVQTLGSITLSFLEKIGDYEIIEKGSSLKFCLIASGKADFYPRLGPTCEWDIAAGHAIAEYAGAKVTKTDGSKILYNIKESYLNDNFFVSNGILEDYDWDLTNID